MSEPKDFYDELREAIKDSPVADCIEVDIDSFECGVHFCPHCGDCLYCYGDENCYNGGENQGPHGFPEPNEENDDNL